MAKRKRKKEREERPKKKRLSRGGKRGKSGFKYKQRDKEAWKKRAEQSGYSKRSMFKPEVNVFRPKDGDNIIRILPPTFEDAEHYGYEIWCHYGVGADNESFLDRNKMLDEPDPIEEERIRAMQENDKEYADKLQSKKRVAVYIIDRDEPEKGLQLWSMPWSMDADITTLAVDKRSGEVLNIDDPEDGYDVEFTKTGKGIKTQYGGIAIARRSSPLDDDDALEAAVALPLPEALVFYSYEDIEKIFAAGGGAYDDDRDEDDDDDDDRPKKRKKDKAKKKKGKKGKKYEPEVPSYEAVMEMDPDELFDLIEDHDLDIDSDIDEDDADDVDGLREDICKELGLKKPKKRKAKSSEKKKLRKRGKRK